MQLPRSIIALMAAVHAASGSPVLVADEGPAALAIRSPTTDPEHWGIATIFYQMGAAGSCGNTNTDDAEIVAISDSWWQEYGLGYFCDRVIKIINTGPSGEDSIGGEGNVVYAVVADTCPGCSETDLDLSKGAWSVLTNGAADSQVGIEWHFCDKDGSC